jgi:Tryptophan-associated transmembrane protein (Trp_oprn_chp)
VKTKRGMLVALAVTALGAALVLGTAGQPRRSADRAQLVGGSAPAATALALVALAGLGLLLLARGRARSFIGGVLVLTGAAVVLVDIYASRSGFFAYSPLAKAQIELHRTAWFWLTALGGVVLASGGLLVAIWGHRWPGTRRDYRARAEPSPVRQDAWTALDRGEDPTI